MTKRVDASQHHLMKWLPRAAVLALLLGVLGFSGMWWSFERTQSFAGETARQVLAIAGQSTELSAEQKQQVERVAQEQELYELYLMPVADGRSNWYDRIKEQAVFVYSDSEKMERVRALGVGPFPRILDNQGAANGSWGVRLEFAALDAWEIGYTLLGLGVGMYWALFWCWGVWKAYLRQRSVIRWAIAYALFNVFAYLVFRISENR